MTRREKLRRAAERKEDICEWCKIALSTVLLAAGALLIYILL